MAARAGLAWMRRSSMTLVVREPLAAHGRVTVTAPGWEARGSDGTFYRILGRPYGRGGRKFWELFVLHPGCAMHLRVPLGFSSLLRVVQDLAGTAEAAYVRICDAQQRAQEKRARVSA